MPHSMCVPCTAIDESFSNDEVHIVAQPSLLPAEAEVDAALMAQYQRELDEVSPRPSCAM